MHIIMLVLILLQLNKDLFVSVHPLRSCAYKTILDRRTDRKMGRTGWFVYIYVSIKYNYLFFSVPCMAVVMIS